MTITMAENGESDDEGCNSAGYGKKGNNDTKGNIGWGW